MEQLSPVYLSAVAGQIGALSAFLGGFAATYLGTLLAMGGDRRSTTVAIGFAAGSSVAFITAVVASTLITAVLQPEAPTSAATVSPVGAQAMMTLSFLLGLYALLVSLALSGWIRSRATGWTTTALAAVGLVLVTVLLVRVG